MPITPPPPVFDPIEFFADRTHGDGVLKIIMRGACAVTVDSIGERRASERHGRERHNGDQQGGELVLTQRVRECDKPVRTRSWTIRSNGDGTFDGALSDATGPVDVRVNGPILSIGYRIRGDLRIAQSIRVAPDGRSAQNTMTARKFGMIVARLDETITKLD